MMDFTKIKIKKSIKQLDGVVCKLYLPIESSEMLQSTTLSNNKVPINK